MVIDSQNISGDQIRIELSLPTGAWLAAEPLVARLRELGARANPAIAPLSNRQKVRALIRRCEDAGREIRVRDVITVADIDESLFFKWQRGEHVSENVRRRCDRTVALSPQEFIVRRLTAATALSLPSEEDE